MLLVKDQKELTKHFHELGKGDRCVAICNYPIHARTLEHRGVQVCPSSYALMMRGYKIQQTHVLSHLMVPHTKIMRNSRDLANYIPVLKSLGIDKVVTKGDTGACGLTVRKWDDLETMYSVMSMNQDAFPIVIQPFLNGAIDYRAILVGDYFEAYERKSVTFRNNLGAGGKATPVTDKETLARLREFSEKVIKEADFPYAHLDIFEVSEMVECDAWLYGDVIRMQRKLYLSELSFDGGLKGAQVDPTQLGEMKLAERMRRVGCVTW